MASYGEALDRVRQQTERNYAAREEDGGILQEIFTGILGELKFPSNYYQLSFEEQRFIDYFLDKMIEMRDNIRVLEDDVKTSFIKQDHEDFNYRDIN